MYTSSFDYSELPKRYDQIYSYFFRRLDKKSDVEKLTYAVLIILAQKQVLIFDPNAYSNQLVEETLTEHINNSNNREFYKLKHQNKHLKLKTKLIKHESRHFLKFKETLLESSQNYCSTIEQKIIKTAISTNFSMIKFAFSAGLTTQKARQELIKAIKIFENNFKIW